MIYEIEYKSSVARDLRKLDKKTTSRILAQIGESFSKDPASGERLHGEFEGLLKMRIGEFRVIYTIIEDRVLVLRIGPRSKVYEY